MIILILEIQQKIVILSLQLNHVKIGNVFSLVEILSDKNGKIHGINLEYDGVFKSKMYPTKIGEELVVSLEMNLGIVDEKPIKEKKIGKFLGIKQTNYRDAVTHIFGTINQENGLITFLGFKLVIESLSVYLRY